MLRLRQIFEFLENLVLDKKKRNEILLLFSCLVLGMVSTFMTVVNIITEEFVIMWITLGFAVFCFLLFFCNLTKIAFLQNLSKIALGIGIVALFAMFTVTGNPQGFSVIWAALLPACGLLLFEMTGGIILSLAVWLMLIFFFWTDLGKSLLLHPEVYTDTFMTRFPMLYIAFLAVSVVLAAMFYITQRSLYRMYRHDPLTKAYNRVGFNEAIANSLQDKRHPSACGFIIGDIDHFKLVNDTYGHFAGDKVLTSISSIMMEATNNPVCRWGGEEFAIFVCDGQSPLAIAEGIRKKVEETEVDADGVKINVTISLGYTETMWSPTLKATELCRDADKALYQAKDEGRNKVIGYLN